MNKKIKINKRSIKFRSPLRYPGGKASLASFIGLAIDHSKLRDVVFVEPFAGGAGASLELLTSGKVQKIIINDLDPAIYSFWETAVNQTDKLINKIRNTKVNISEWFKQKKIYQNKSSSKFELAFATFFLNRTNRSGIIKAGPIGGKYQTGEWKINARFNKAALVERLRVLKMYRKKIEVSKLDGIKLLKQLEKKGKSNYFVFIDPPYIKKGKLLYLNYYEKNDHIELANFLKITNLNWIMTYDDTAYIRNLYKNQNASGFTLNHFAHAVKQGKEVLIYPQKEKYTFL